MVLLISLCLTLLLIGARRSLTSGALLPHRWIHAGAGVAMQLDRSVSGCMLVRVQYVC